MRDRNFANGRNVRNFFEKLIANQADRLCYISNPSKEELSLLTLKDIYQTLKDHYQK